MGSTKDSSFNASRIVRGMRSIGRKMMNIRNATTVETIENTALSWAPVMKKKENFRREKFFPRIADDQSEALDKQNSEEA